MDCSLLRRAGRPKKLTLPTAGGGCRASSFIAKQPATESIETAIKFRPLRPTGRRDKSVYLRPHAFHGFDHRARCR